MKMALKKCTAKNASSARVVDGKLILSFPHALTPVVWQMDLIQAKASACEVREDAKGHFVLILKTKNESVDIAPFAEKTEAVEALMAVAHALENAQGQIRPAGTETVYAPGPQMTPQMIGPRRGGKWGGIALGIILIFILFVTWSMLLPGEPLTMNTGGAGTAATSAGSSPNFSGSDEAGVPLSADQFLMKRQ